MTHDGRTAHSSNRLIAWLSLAGFSLLIAWHYCLWFVPRTFYHLALLDDQVTIDWLAYLLAAVVTLWVVPALCKRRCSLRQLRTTGVLLWLAVAVCSSGTLALGLWPPNGNLVASCLISSLTGCAAALLWLFWGEHIAAAFSSMPMHSAAFAVGVTLLVTLLVSSLLPEVAATVFVALLLLGSGGLLFVAARVTRERALPVLLPPETARQGFRSTAVVCVIVLFVSMAAYFLVTIISWEQLPGEQYAFTFGVAAGALLMLLIALVARLLPHRFNAFRLQPWLLVLLVMAYALYLVGAGLRLPAYLLALSISSVFELFLVVYLAILTLKGYITPLFGFGLSAGCVRLGMLLGNLLSLLYERVLSPEGIFSPAAGTLSPEGTLSPFDVFLSGSALIDVTALVFICLLVALIVPLIRQEYQISSLTQQHDNVSDLDFVCAAIAHQFALSEREADVLRLMARGHSSSNIANRLVLSTNTVNTHVRHIYEKLNIHKRSELIEYINRQ